MAKNDVQISRVTRSKEDAKSSYNRMSTWYDAVAGLGERKPRESGVQLLDARAGENILEIGFGTGHSILAFARAVGDSGKVYGVDISEGMLDITQSRVRKAGLLDRVELVCDDAAQLPYETNFFNAIFMSFTLELFDTPEIPLVLQECNRVLCADGRMCVVSMTKEEDEGLPIRIYEWVHMKIPKFLDCRPIFVRRSLEDAGFEIVKTQEMSMWSLPVDIVLAKVSNQ